MIAAIVNFFGLQIQHVGRTSNDTKVASLASYIVDFYGSCNFGHVVWDFGECDVLFSIANIIELFFSANFFSHH